MMDYRDRRPGGRTILALVLALVCTGSAWAQSPADTNDEADSTVVQEAFAGGKGTGVMTAVERQH